MRPWPSPPLLERWYVKLVIFCALTALMAFAATLRVG